MADSFSTRDQLEVNGKTYAYASLPKLGERFAKLDADSDGFVAADEQRAAREALREQRHERRAARRIHQPASPAPASE